ncbi:MAG: HAMP domain-containing sensor histidine kinase [Pseudomonadota bacterium]
MIVAYTELLEYYLQLGIDLRTQSFLEAAADDYERKGESASSDQQTTGARITAYRSPESVPQAFRSMFAMDDPAPGHMQRYVNLDFDGDDSLKPVDTMDLCGVDTCELVFLYTHELRDGDWLYLLHGVVGSDSDYSELAFTERVAYAIGGLFALLFSLVCLVVIRSIDRPLRRLERWSAALDENGADEQLPELRFLELRQFAQRLRSAFERLREGVEKEQFFLRNASHELRTPLSILSANVELIDRLTQRPERSAVEQASFDRQYRALEEVRLLIETLLWLNRQSDRSPSVAVVDLKAELDQIVQSHQYLLEARAVTFSIQDASETLHQPVAPVRVVLSNLVRNAFQHAPDGEVRICIDAYRVSVRNAVVPDAVDRSLEPAEAESRFGLGLQLVKMLCDRFQWSYVSEEVAGERITQVSFQSQSPTDR